MFRAIDDLLIDRIHQPIADLVQNVPQAIYACYLAYGINELIAAFTVYDHNLFMTLLGIYWIRAAARARNRRRRSERIMMAERVRNPERINPALLAWRLATLLLLVCDLSVALALALPRNDIWFVLFVLNSGVLFVLMFGLQATDLPAPRASRSPATNPWLAANGAGG